VTFSRFIWIEGLFALLVYFFTLSRGQKLALMVSFAVLIPVVASMPLPIIQNRFASSTATNADAIRSHQYEALTQDADQSFFVGHGFGSFPFEMVRDIEAPYSYELQWFALMYQMGIIGIIFLLGVLFLNSAPLLASRSAEAIPVLLLYGFSLLSGFANPSLIGRSAGVGFSFVLFLGIQILSREKLFRRGNPPPSALGLT
jgi:hypothetical protein